MAKRKIIKIDRDKCNGCGLCTTACAEGALVLDKDKKAVLAKEIYCDGMGACLDVCPTGALTIEERESEGYDAKAAHAHVLKTQGKEPLPCGCPGTMAKEIKKNKPERTPASQGDVSSELSQWPIQLHLVSPLAPYFNNCDLLIAADCTAFALGGFHQELLKGKKLIIACPKLDETSHYIEKIAEILKNNTVYSLTVARMVVPCCTGLTQMVKEAAKLSGADINAKEVVIDLEGNKQ